MHHLSLCESFRTRPSPGAGEIPVLVLPSSTQENDFVVVLWFPSKVKHSLSSRTMKSKGSGRRAAKIIEAMLQES